jgi:hypothetical protein
MFMRGCVVLLVRACIVLLLLSAPACHSSSTAPTTSSIALAGTSMLTAIGQTSQLTATETLSSGTTQDITSQATWLSSNTTVATVSPAGLVTAQGIGVSSISATFSGVTAMGNVVVALQSALVFTFTPSPVTNIGLSSLCTGGTPFVTWFFNLTIQNASSVPFVVTSWSYNTLASGTTTPSVQNEDPTAFNSIFHASSIPGNGSVQGSNLCTYMAVSPGSGSVTLTFTGASSNGPFTTQALQLN